MTGADIRKGNHVYFVARFESRAFARIVMNSAPGGSRQKQTEKNIRSCRAAANEARGDVSFDRVTETSAVTVPTDKIDRERDCTALQPLGRIASSRRHY